jgi:hypothetical protein
MQEHPTPKPVEQDMNYIHARCVIAEDDAVMDDQWPVEFVALPVLGDFVQSKNGSTLKIIRVTHTTDDNNEPVVELELGRDRTASVSTMFG